MLCMTVGQSKRYFTNLTGLHAVRHGYLSAWFSKSTIKDLIADKASRCPPGRAHPPAALHAPVGFTSRSSLRCASMVAIMRLWSP